MKIHKAVIPAAGLGQDCYQPPNLSPKRCSLWGGSQPSKVLEQKCYENSWHLFIVLNTYEELWEVARGMEQSKEYERCQVILSLAALVLSDRIL